MAEPAKGVDSAEQRLFRHRMNNMAVIIGVGVCVVAIYQVGQHVWVPRFFQDMRCWAGIEYFKRIIH